jgi:hypothetical protein
MKPAFAGCESESTGDIHGERPSGTSLREHRAGGEGYGRHDS